jgi:hypothetical protein
MNIKILQFEFKFWYIEFCSGIINVDVEVIHLMIHRQYLALRRCPLQQPTPIAWPLISESVVVIRIDIHPAGEEPDQYIVHLASQVSRMTTVCKVPTKSKVGPYSQDEVLAPSDRLARPSSWAALFSLQQTTSKQGGTIWQNSYWATRFTMPHKPDMWSVQVKDCHRGQNEAILNRHRRGLQPWNLIITIALYPPFPSEWSTFPYLPHPVTPTNMNINIVSTHRNHHILLVHEKEALRASGTYHSSSTDVCQPSIALLVDNIDTSITRMAYGSVLPCNLSLSYKNLHIVHNQHMQR